MKQEAEGARSGPSEGEQEAQEQLLRCEAELAKEQAACLKLQRQFSSSFSPDDLVIESSLCRTQQLSQELVNVSPGSPAWGFQDVTGRHWDDKFQYWRLCP